MALISVVTATFNRAQVLRVTLESLRAQTFMEWELLVVGDACTDDTADVVASFGDARMRFVNLPENSGDQAAPNNEGVRLGSSAYVAFLNHDDLWTPDHLATSLAALQSANADLVFTMVLALSADGAPLVEGVAPSGAYDGRTIAPASGWLLRRELAASVGPWRRAKETHAAPSQDWIFRAWKKGHRLIAVPKPTVFALPSGTRKNSYTTASGADEHARYAKLLREDPDFLARLLAQVIVQLRGELASPARMARRSITSLLGRALTALHIQPHAVSLALKYRRRGGLIDALRRTRGLKPLARK
jgi:glycosyltransferase involved in cell wall biosynthesis